MSALDLSPAVPVLLVGGLLAGAVLLWLALRHRRASWDVRLRALTWLTVFLTFDLVLFGAFTRLSDSGLGCPDWPGCYGSASPLGAHAHISSAQAALPQGPVTHGKAWVEMIHRYLATGVGALVTVLAVAAWVAARRSVARSPWWATLTWVWVCVQGAFGALTVAWKLYPLVVTLHLLGGVGLLALLAVQAVRWPSASGPGLQALFLPPRVRVAAWVVFALCLAQAALGAWVSSNYAVLACRDFPTCQGQWWPAMDFGHGFTLRRELGMTGDAAALPFDALVAIHWTHRLGAFVVFAGTGLLIALLWRLRQPEVRGFAKALAGLLAWQFATGLSNVVLDWPLPAALGHTGGAALLITLLAVLLARSAASRPAFVRTSSSSGPAGFPGPQTHHG